MPAIHDAECLSFLHAYRSTAGKGSWAGLNMQYERVRIGTDPDRRRRCDTFLQVGFGAGGQALEAGLPVSIHSPACEVPRHTFAAPALSRTPPICPRCHPSLPCRSPLQFFEREGCNMVEMSCEEHDQLAASTQFITHTVGRMLGAMQASILSAPATGLASH